jgi:predicted transcriptional regulator
MTIELTPEQHNRLEQIAIASSQSPEEIAALGLTSYLRHLDDLTAAVREGEESAEREGWLTTDEVFERLYQRLPRTA